MIFILKFLDRIMIVHKKCYLDLIQAEKRIMEMYKELEKKGTNKVHWWGNKGITVEFKNPCLSGCHIIQFELKYVVEEHSNDWYN